MNGRKLTEHQAMKSLLRKRVEFKIIDLTNTKFILIGKAKHLGNKSWGLIDFLCNHHGWYVSGFKKYAGLNAKKHSTDLEVQRGI